MQMLHCCIGESRALLDVQLQRAWLTEREDKTGGFSGGTARVRKRKGHSTPATRCTWRRESLQSSVALLYVTCSMYATATAAATGGPELKNLFLWLKIKRFFFNFYYWHFSSHNFNSILTQIKSKINAPNQSFQCKMLKF